jgi:hypothetical protein
MAIPDHVRQQAMDAVAYHASTAFIRQQPDSGISVSQESLFHQPDTTPHAPINDDVRRQAMDAVSDPSSKALVQLVKDADSIEAPWTPSPEAERFGERIADMHKSGQDVGSIQQSITKDDFGSEYGT